MQSSQQSWLTPYQQLQSAFGTTPSSTSMDLLTHPVTIYFHSQPWFFLTNNQSSFLYRLLPFAFSTLSMKLHVWPNLTLFLTLRSYSQMWHDQKVLNQSPHDLLYALFDTHSHVFLGVFILKAAGIWRRWLCGSRYYFTENLMFLKQQDARSCIGCWNYQEPL